MDRVITRLLLVFSLSLFVVIPASAEMVKVIEVIAESKKSWDEAAENAVKEASKSVLNIKSLYVQDMQAVVEDGRISKYRLNARISFVVE